MIPLVAALLGLVGGQLLSNLFTSTPIAERKEALINSLLPSTRVPVEQLVLLRLWDKITDDEYHEQLRYSGFTEERADQILEASRQYLGASEVVAEYYRSKGPGAPETRDLDAIAEELVKHGYSPEEAKKYALIAHPYPSTGDVITWAVREAFTPTAISKWGLMEAYPPELNEWGRAVGYTPEILEKYWIAHWRWPSPYQAAEFMHRTAPSWYKWRKFTEDDYKELLKVADYVPGTHDLLLTTAFHPYTRVDVRRMHKIGVLSDEQLVDAYMEVGFDREHAENMAKFTILYNGKVEPDEHRDLTRSLVERGYDLGLLNKTEAVQGLEGLGYATEDAEFIISIVDFSKSMDYADNLIAIYTNQFKWGMISEGELTSKLQQLGLDSDSIARYIHLAETAAEQPTKLPSKTDIKSLYKYGYITRREAKETLMKIGYSEKWSERLLKWWEGAPGREEAMHEAQAEAGGGG